jgi:cellulose synthase/poly-beta-1,6-N-acetylglucosamine synthase-like glycosyltransferase
MNADFIFLRNLTIFFATAMVIKYYIFLMLAPFHSVKEVLRERRMAKLRLEPSYKPYEPLVSIIIPAWNEEIGIIKTIRSILNNTYSRFEVIVVNDGSTDGSDKIMRDFISISHFKDTLHPRTKIRYFHQENGGKGTALNHGITKSKGEIVMTVDADSALDPEAIARMVTYFEDPKIDAAVGNVKVAKNRSVVGFIQALEYMFGFYFKRTHSVLNAEYIYGGACAAFRKNKTFEQLGLFDEANKTEDIEMSLRTRYHGLHSVYAEDVVCYTEGASTVQGLINQRLRWKKGRFDTLIRYRQMFFSLQKRHNRALCWFILPYCLLSEAQLFFEPLGITLLLSYSIISGDYLSLTLGLLFIFAIYLVNALFNHEKINFTVLLLFPFTWPLFYFLVWIEWVALIKSTVMMIRGDEIVWQQWDRQGVEVAV